MTDPKALERLHNSKDFLTFLQEVSDNKDATVRSLYGCNNEQLQQKAGIITAYVELLDECQFEKVKASWERLES